MAKANVRPKIVMEIGSREAVREAVASGVGFGFVSSAEYIADDRIRSLPVVDAEIFNYAHIVCRQDRLQSRLISAFLEVTSALPPAAHNGGSASA